MAKEIDSLDLGACQLKRICNSRGTLMAVEDTAKMSEVTQF